MLATIDPLVRVLKDHAAWWGPALGVGAVLETVPILGVLVPVSPLIIALGAAIAAGALPTQTLLWALGGAVVGNAGAFEVGRAFPAWRPSNADLGHAYDKASRLLARRGTAAILLSRLISGVVGLVSFAAGLARTPRPNFYSVCLIANLLWVVIMAALGYAGAIGWRRFGTNYSPLVLGAVTVLGVGAVVAWRRWRPENHP